MPYGMDHFIGCQLVSVFISIVYDSGSFFAANLAMCIAWNKSEGRR
jgi:hypothetical protein